MYAKYAYIGVVLGVNGAAYMAVPKQVVSGSSKARSYVRSVLAPHVKAGFQPSRLDRACRLGPRCPVLSSRRRSWRDGEEGGGADGFRGTTRADFTLKGM